MKILERLKKIIQFNIQDENLEGNRNHTIMKETQKDIQIENQEQDPSLEEGEIEYEIVEREILPEKIICPDCGGITLEGLDFCDKCGGELHIYNR